MEQYIIPGIVAILVAVIEAVAIKERKADKAQRERMEQRAAIRAEESRLSMQMMDANIALSLATVIAVQEKKFNGELRAAKEKVEAAQDEYGKFLERIASREVTRI